MAAPANLRAWVQKISAEEFADRIGAEPGFLDYCDSGGDALGVLHHAAAEGRIDLLELILDRGATIDMPTGTRVTDGESATESSRFDPGFTPLTCAAASGQVATVRYLIDAGADPSKKDYNAGTALHSAAARGSVPILNVLLAAGCDPDAECGYKANCEELGFYWINTALHVAAVRGHGAAVRTLIGHGAIVDALGMLDGRRPLHYAAAIGASGAVDVLLRSGADPSRPEVFHGFTPLHYAAQEGHVECVALLLRYGADPKARLAKTGYTALDLGRNFSVPERAQSTCRLLSNVSPAQEV